MSLLATWRPALGSLEEPIRIADFMLPHLRRWLDRTWLEAGVPLRLPPPTISLCTDASTAGWGAHMLPSFETVSGTWSDELATTHINELELRAVFLALRHWGDALANKSVMVLSDNSTVVAYIRKQGGTLAPHLCLLVWEMLRCCDSRGIRVEVRHIPGKLNVLAESLSRRDQIVHTEWSLCPLTFDRICARYGKPHIDLFATRWNKKLPTFVSPFPDPTAFAIDALSIRWEEMFAFAYPPSVLVPKVIQKIKETVCSVVLVAPLKWDKSWVSDLLDLASEVPRKIPPKLKLLKQPRQMLFHPCPERLKLHVWKLSNKPSQADATRVRQWKESRPLEGPPL